MIRAILVAVASGMSLSIAQQSDTSLIELQALTVPAWKLPQDCALSPPSVLTTDNGRPANWAGLKIPTNPWNGSNKPLLATIRERMGGTAQPPDGPPLTARQAASYRLHLADGIEEGYVAVYAPTQDPQSSRLVVVYALRFSEGAQPSDSSATTETTSSSQIARMWVGRTLVVVHSHNEPCFRAIGSHLQSLKIQK